MVCVRATLLESFRTQHAAGLIAMEDWTEVMLPQLDRLFSRTGVEVLVRHLGDDGETDVIGWLAHRRGHRSLHEASYGQAMPYIVYAWTKDWHRRRGHFRALATSVGIRLDLPFEYAASTTSLHRMRRSIPHARWAPLAIRFESAPTFEENPNGKRDDRRPHRAAATRP